MSVADMHQMTKIDKWFLERLQGIADAGVNLKTYSIDTITEDVLTEAKKLGFSDYQIGFWLV